MTETEKSYGQSNIDTHDHMISKEVRNSIYQYKKQKKVIILRMWVLA